MITKDFYTPSGYFFSIREQNGEDEEILSNVNDMASLMNFTKFIQAIVVSTDFTQSGKLTIQDVLKLPVNDRYCILFQSRIFSLGDTVEFEYNWPTGKVEYEQNLNELLYDYDPNKPLTEEDLNAKPDAIPFYPNPKQKSFEYTTLSGKKILFDILDGEGEKKMVTMPRDKQTRNSPLLCRNLQLEVDGKWELVQNFKLFSVRDMQEIRRYVLEVDPTYTGEVEIENPADGSKTKFPIIIAKDFFFLTD